ncbi:Uncharacterized protein FWK35_00005324 [Aphis craccivora]|uniref:Transposable element P transposase n=1 Tax=Aphis craccivora TaxID=307492 RepID=A0A6G0YGS2_APHCR|nr:Uncharacterized protein FWK35_00005324 [Aphis craccivora]
MVNDMGPSNLALWRYLNISNENTSFKYLNTGNSIYIFADTPHLLKLFRNHLLDVFI